APVEDAAAPPLVCPPPPCSTSRGAPRRARVRPQLAARPLTARDQCEFALPAPAVSACPIAPSAGPEAVAGAAAPSGAVALCATAGAVGLPRAASTAR